MSKPGIADMRAMLLMYLTQQMQQGPHPGTTQQPFDMSILQAMQPPQPGNTMFNPQAMLDPQQVQDKRNPVMHKRYQLMWGGDNKFTGDGRMERPSPRLSNYASHPQVSSPHAGTAQRQVVRRPKKIINQGRHDG